ncbi:MAG: alpha/beta hydrolase [Candidatus Neomarinimicrobiota bacterium]
MHYHSISSSKNTKYVIIALHGWKGNLYSMEIITKAFNIKNIKWLFLQGPYKINNKEFSWFKEDDVIGWQYSASFDSLKKMIFEVNKSGFPLNNIYILGFSQGACLAMEFIIRQQFSIGGIIPIAGFIGLKDKFKIDILNSNPNTPVLLIHGNSDNVVLVRESKIAHNLFMNAGFDVTIHILSGKHKIPLKAKELIKKFIYGNKN